MEYFFDADKPHFAIWHKEMATVADMPGNCDGCSISLLVMIGGTLLVLERIVGCTCGILRKENRKGYSYSAVIGMAAVPHIVTLDGALYQKFPAL